MKKIRSGLDHMVVLVVLVFAGIVLSIGSSCKTPDSDSSAEVIGCKTPDSDSAGVIGGNTADKLPAPTNLRALVEETYSGLAVTLTWTPVPDATRYPVYRSTDDSDDYACLFVTYNQTVYSDSKSLKQGTTYSYRVGALKGATSGEPVGDLTEIVVHTGLLGPNTISANAVPEGIRITWTPREEAALYRIYRGINFSSMEPLSFASVTEYIDTLVSTMTYYYRISVVDSEQREGPLSINYTSAAPAVQSVPAQQAVPVNLKATVHDNKTITLSWDAIPKANSYQIFAAYSIAGPYGFVITYSASLGPVFNVASLSPNSGVPLTGNTELFFKVSANNGPLSDPIRIITGP